MGYLLECGVAPRGINDVSTRAHRGEGAQGRASARSHEAAASIVLQPPVVAVLEGHTRREENDVLMVTRG